MGSIRCTRGVNQASPLPNRATTPGKSTSPWTDRIVLASCLAGAWMVAPAAFEALDSNLGILTKPVAVLGLGLAAVLLTEQICRLIEKLRGIR
mgnify:FL=1